MKFILVGAVLLLASGFGYAKQEYYEEGPFSFELNPDKGEAWLTNVEEMEEVVIPSEITVDNKTYTVTQVSVYAFDRCRDMKKLTVPSSVNYFCRESFRGLTQLNELHIEDLASWCSSFFSSDIVQHAMVDLIIADYYNSNPICPNTVIYVNGIPMGEDFVIPEGVDRISRFAFRNLNCKTLRLPDSLQTIEFGAFYGSTVEQIDFGNGIRKIGLEAFKGCKNLKTLAFPEGTEIVDERAIQSCPALESISYPASIKSCLGQYSKCENLRSIEVAAKEPPYGVSPTSFGYWVDDRVAKSCIVCVPKESVGLYKDDPYWGRFIKIIGMDFGTASAVMDEADIAKDTEDPIYTIYGQRVAAGNLIPGIYIRDGKKFMVK